MVATIHVDDIGTKFEATIKDEDGVVVDVSTATTKEMVFNAPDGIPAVKTASFSSDGTDGKIKYVTVDGDIDQDGYWRVQGFVIIGTSEFHSDVHSFQVYKNLERPTP